MGFPETFAIGGAEVSLDGIEGGREGRRGGGGAPEDTPGGRFYKQVGNAACPPVIAAIAERIARLLFSESTSFSPGGAPNSNSSSNINSSSKSSRRLLSELAPALDLVLAALPPSEREALVGRNPEAFSYYAT
jgi:hypothetical protein